MRCLTPPDVVPSNASAAMMETLQSHLAATLLGQRDSDAQRDIATGLILVPVNSRGQYAPTATKEVAVLAGQAFMRLDPSYDETYLPFATQPVFDNLRDLIETKFVDTHTEWGIAGLWHAHGIRHGVTSARICYGAGHVTTSIFNRGPKTSSQHSYERRSVDAGITLESDEFIHLDTSDQLVIAHRHMERHVATR